MWRQMGESRVGGRNSKPKDTKRTTWVCLSLAMLSSVWKVERDGGWGCWQGQGMEGWGVWIRSLDIIMQVSASQIWGFIRITWRTPPNTERPGPTPREADLVVLRRGLRICKFWQVSRDHTLRSPPADGGGQLKDWGQFRMRFKVSLVTLRPHRRAQWEATGGRVARAGILCSPVTAGPGGWQALGRRAEQAASRVCGQLGATPGSFTLFLPLLRVARGRVTCGHPGDPQGCRGRSPAGKGKPPNSRSLQTHGCRPPGAPSVSAGAARGFLESLEEGRTIIKAASHPLSVSAGGKTIFS